MAEGLKPLLNPHILETRNISRGSTKQRFPGYALGRKANPDVGTTVPPGVRQRSDDLRNCHVVGYR